MSGVVSGEWWVRLRSGRLVSAGAGDGLLAEEWVGRFGRNGLLSEGSGGCHAVVWGRGMWNGLGLTRGGGMVSGAGLEVRFVPSGGAALAGRSDWLFWGTGGGCGVSPAALRMSAG